MLEKLDMSLNDFETLKILKHKKNNENRKYLRRKFDKEYRKKYPEKEKCKQRTRYLIRIGKIKKKPCIYCGDMDSEAHHNDYSKPEKIIWVCRKCHIMKYHKK